MSRFSNRSSLSTALALLSIVLVGSIRTTTVRGDEPDKPIRALLVTGGCCHDYPHQKDIVTKGISARANVEWTISFDPDTTTKHLNPIYESDDWAKGYDVIVHDECTCDVVDMKIIDRILKPHRDGLPAVVLHCGMHCYRTPGWQDGMTPWFEFTGLQTNHHNWQKPISISFVDKESPITKGMADWTTINEELYMPNKNGKLLDTAHALAQGKQPRAGAIANKDVVDKNPKPDVNTDAMDEDTVVWTNRYNGKTRVFATTIGHNNDTVADSRYLDMITRGLLWSVDKLDDAHLKPAKKVLIDQ